LAIASSASRWSMSVWVMTSPLTIAVALTTDGIGVPNICGIFRQASAVALFGLGGQAAAAGLLRRPASGERPAKCAPLAPDARVEIHSKSCCHPQFSLFPKPICRLPFIPAR
jgi:hypothetical protein